MSKVYTKGGDKGFTDLYGGTRTSKSSSRVTAYGSVDEANASIGLAASNIKKSIYRDLLRICQEKLFVIGGELASDEVGIAKLKSTIGETDVEFLEKVIDEISGKLSDKPFFILPGASKESGFLHLARTAVRRAERAIVNLSEEMSVNVHLIKYINRLSDMLFVLSRTVDEVESKDQYKEESEMINVCIANEMAEACMKKSNELKVPVVISIVDEGGNLILLNRMSEALIGSIDIATNKAYTSLSLKLSTDALGELSQPGQPLYGIQNTNQGRIVIFGGGYPLYHSGKIVGAIGISGGSVEEDMAIAKEAVKIFEMKR